MSPTPPLPAEAPPVEADPTSTLEGCRTATVAARAESTEARHAQATTEARYQFALAAAHMTTWEWSATGACRLDGSDLPGTAVGVAMDQETFLGTVHPEDRQRVLAAVHDALHHPHAYVIEFRIVTPGGIRWIEAHGDAFQDPSGEPRTMGVLVDITDHKDATLLHQRLAEQLERQVIERTEAIATANRELEAFAWSVSHDLRAPLRAIDGFSSLLEEDAGTSLDATSRGYLARIRGAAQRMGELIDDLLMLSRVTRTDLTVTEIDLSRLAEEVIADLRAKQTATGTERQVTVDIQRGMHARGDARLVRIVLENLLANAWKFTRARAQAHIVVEQAEDGTVRVVDDGVGFDMGQRHRLFVPFQRLHSPEPYEGSGIGLATVQRIVLRHAGQVGAESRPDGGAVFWFRLRAV